jgi:hypothetical protein
MVVWSHFLVNWFSTWRFLSREQREMNLISLLSWYFSSVVSSGRSMGALLEALRPHAWLQKGEFAKVFFGFPRHHKQVSRPWDPAWLNIVVKTVSGIVHFSPRWEKAYSRWLRVQNELPGCTWLEHPGSWHVAGWKFPPPPCEAALLVAWIIYE